MPMNRVLAVLLVGVGMLFGGVSLGLLYMDFKQREGAWVESTRFRVIEGDFGEPIEGARRNPWETDGFDVAQLVFGSLAMAFVGSGLMIAVFNLPWFQRAGSASSRNDSV